MGDSETTCELKERRMAHRKRRPLSMVVNPKVNTALREHERGMLKAELVTLLNLVLSGAAVSEFALERVWSLSASGASPPSRTSGSNFHLRSFGLYRLRETTPTVESFFRIDPREDKIESRPYSTCVSLYTSYDIFTVYIPCCAAP